MAGVVKSVDFYDPVSVTRFWWALKAFQRHRLTQSRSYQHAEQLTIALAHGDLDNKKKSLETALDLGEALDIDLRPWDYRERPKIEDMAERMTKTWEDYFGKMDDPETQAKIQATVDLLESMNLRNQQRG